MNETVKRFWELCDQARYETNVLNLYGTLQYELSLRKILEHIKVNSERREIIAAQLVYILEYALDAFAYPLDIVDFCMRELRWSEIADAIRDRIKITSEDPSICNSFKTLLTAYDVIWHGNYYEYYKSDFAFGPCKCDYCSGIRTP
jgi:hypothetical protein